jgi:U3 small nucleolar RNA-associated protein 12
MVKAYLRYEQARAFGVIASPEACPVYADEKGKLVVTAALERLAVWDVRRGVEHQSLIPPARESGVVPAVTKIARAPGSSLVAAGAADGSIRLWNLEDGTSDVMLKGHKSEVTALRFNASGSLLVSGGKDTNVVVWDVVAETGLCRLRGHKDQVTDAAFVETMNPSTPNASASAGARLVTCGKDAAVRVWDLDTQHCAQTLAHFGAECWSLDVDPKGARLVVGTADERLHVFSVFGRGGSSDEDVDDEDVDDEKSTDRTSADRTRGGDVFGNANDTTRAARAAASIADASTLLTPMGFVRRADRSRVSTVRFDERGGFLGVQTAGRAVEVYRCRDARETAKRLKRRAKRKREKQTRKKEKTSTASDSDDDDDDDIVVSASDVVDLAAVVRTKAKTRGFAFAPRARLKKRPGVKVVLAVLTDNNAVEEWEIASADPNDETDDAGSKGGSKDLAEPTRARALEAAGHRADVRAAALSPDDATLVTCSHKGVKVWDPGSGACARTIEGGYGLCVLFAPGGRHVVVGTKTGALELFDAHAGAALGGGAPDAHEGAVWGMAALPDGSGFVTASADKTVKFFEWTLAEVTDVEEAGETEPAATGTRRELGVAHVKTLQMAEDVLSVGVTPDGKLLSVSLLDNTLKVFFLDSLKFFLSLYGHRLPALCHDVSSDSRLLASGGADKNIRVWGLDFGDCHKSLFAHDDSVTCLKFVPKTHYLFSCGKDSAVKYWDADKFEPLLTLNGHHAAAWCCAMSRRGDFLVTGGHDRAIRVWERTDEPFFVDEEKERRLESLLEEGDGAGADDDDDRVAAAARDAAAARGASAPAGAEAGMASRATLETLSAADAIVDALDVARHERERIDAHVKKKARMALEVEDSVPGNDAGDDENAQKKQDAEKLRRLFAGDDEDEDEHDVASMRSDDSDDDAARARLGNGENGSYPKGLAPNPLLMGASPERYALRALEHVKAADLERAVLALPFSSAAALLEFLGGWLERGEKVELTCRLAALIVRLHYAQLGATANARGTLLKIRPMLRARAASFRDVVGFNLAGLGMWAARVEETAGSLGLAGKKRGKSGEEEEEDDDGDDDELLDDEDAGVAPGWG